MSVHTAAGNGGELTVAQWAEQATQAIRELNHLTRPGLGAINDPDQAGQVLAALAAATGGLPQLLGQLGTWLHQQARQGRLRVDACSPHQDAAAAVTAAIEELTRASGCAHTAGAALDTAQQTLAQLAMAAPRRAGDEPEWS